MRTLIADDKAMSRHLLQKTLERAGYEVLASRMAARPRTSFAKWMGQSSPCWTG
jgi:CheY-like chemotaxis protein